MCRIPCCCCSVSLSSLLLTLLGLCCCDDRLCVGIDLLATITKDTNSFSEEILHLLLKVSPCECIKGLHCSQVVGVPCCPFLSLFLLLSKCSLPKSLIVAVAIARSSVSWCWSAPREAVWERVGGRPMRRQ